MNTPKIIFVLSSTSTQRCIKRIDEFIENNYEVEVFGFSRGTPVFSNSNYFDIKILGEFSNSMNYFRRMILIGSKIKNLITKNKGKNVVFYFFGLDTALITLLLPVKYFYEESDLVHTYIDVKLVRDILDRLDKKIIKNSLETIFTSEGFKRYHFGENEIRNVSVVPNRLNKNIDLANSITKDTVDIDCLRIGFVGSIRFDSVINFVKVFAKNFSNHEIHFFGTIDRSVVSQVEELIKFPNVFNHGPFKNPQDLPVIYEKIDFVLSTYDPRFQNVQYAEPNKLYESIFFRTPIIVSSDTFLSQKVSELGIGYSVDPFNDSEIVELIKSITKKEFNDKKTAIARIPKESAISLNHDLFKKITTKLANLN